MRRFLDKISEKLLDSYERIASKKNGSTHMHKYDKELSSLSPGVECKKLVRNYYIKKIGNSILIIASAIVVAIMYLLANIGNTVISENNTLQRHESGVGNYSLNLKARTDDYDYGNVNISVEERRLTKAEYDDMIDRITSKLPEIILGENASLDHIDTEMNLPSSVDGYPFSIRWEVSDYSLLHNNGDFGDIEADEKGNSIQLKAIITYKDTEYIEEYNLIIFPHRKTEDESRLNELKQAIDAENKDTGEKLNFKLPETIDGKGIEWSESKEPVLILVIIGMIVAVFAIWKGSDKDLKDKCEDRDRVLLIEYSEFVSKLQLLLSSGLTIRGAFERMSQEYRHHVREGGKKKYVYEELQLCVRKMQDGLNEATCYEFFGNRCGLLCYKKLASLLVQNLRKGTDGLISTLADEATDAFEERKAIARRMGEEAQTKLLFPMILMLSVVMIIIMIPAYLSFGGM